MERWTKWSLWPLVAESEEPCKTRLGIGFKLASTRDLPLSEIAAVRAYDKSQGNLDLATKLEKLPPLWRLSRKEKSAAALELYPPSEPSW